MTDMKFAPSKLLDCDLDFDPDLIGVIADSTRLDHDDCSSPYDAPQGGKVLTSLDRICFAWHCVRDEGSNPFVLLKPVSPPDGEAKGKRR